MQVVGMQAVGNQSVVLGKLAVGRVQVHYWLLDCMATAVVRNSVAAMGPLGNLRIFHSFLCNLGQEEPPHVVVVAPPLLLSVSLFLLSNSKDNIDSSRLYNHQTGAGFLLQVQGILG